MKKSAILLTLFVFSALPAAAQHNEFGILFGDSKALKSGAGKGKFESGMRELYYGMQLEPGTFFRIELGRMDVKTALPNGSGGFDVDNNGTVEHADGIIEYRFSEAYGYTGLFLGAGLYRQKTNGADQSDYGFQAGINGVFPLNRTYAIVAEGAYHWVNVYTPRPRFATLGVGVRMSF